MADNVKAVAKANPTKHYAEVDAPSSGPNVYGLQFNTAQGAFLGGYLAAGMTQDRQGRDMGRPEHPAGDHLHGRVLGGRAVLQPAEHKNVQVLGWNETNQKGGTFSQSFTDQNKGKQISQTFIHQGADIIFPVAGGAGLGAAAAAQAAGGNVNVIWVDTDGCVSAAQYCKYFLSSVTKNLAGSVQTYLDAGGHRARSRPVPTSGRWRTTAPAWRRTTIRSNIPASLKSRARHGQGGHLLRQDQDHLAQPAGALTTSATARRRDAGLTAVRTRHRVEKGRQKPVKLELRGDHQALRLAHRQRPRRPRRRTGRDPRAARRERRGQVAP